MVDNRSAAALGQTLRGSGDFHAWTDSSLYLRRKRQGLVLTVEHRSAPTPEPLRLALAGDDACGDLHLELLGDDGPDDVVDRDLHRDVLDALTRAPQTRTDLRAQLRIRNERLGAVLADLRDRHKIRRLRGLWQLVPVPAP